MSDPKAGDAKVADPKPAEAKAQEAKAPVAPAPEAKAPVAPAPEAKAPAVPAPETKASAVPAPEAKAAAAKPEEAKPAPAPKAETKPAPAAPAKAPEAKPAEAKAAAAPAAPAAVAALETKPAGIPGLTRAPTPKAPEQSVNITISANAAMMIMGGLSVVVLLLIGLTLFLLWKVKEREPMSHLVIQKPGMDGSGNTDPVAPGKGTEKTETKASAAPEKVEIGVNFKDNLGGTASQLKGSWPTFRGPNSDNVAADAVPLANKWAKGGPKPLWTIPDLGQGYSGPSVHAGRVYLQDYDVKLREESLRCFSLDDGKEIWRRSYPLKLVNSHAFTRTVPAVTDKYVVCMGAMCHVVCVDAGTGAMKWGLDLMKEYGTRSMADQWYTAQCPIIDGTTAVIAPCGKDALMIGVDCETGKEVWRTPNPKNYIMSHASIVPMTIGTKKMYVYCAIDGKVAGVSASKEDAGALLWESQSLGVQVIAPSPCPMEDGYLFITAGYGAGSVLIKITEEGGKFTSKIVWTMAAKDTLSCEQQTPVYYKKHLFALMPDSSGGMKQQLACMNPYENGKIVWMSGKDKRFGQYEPILIADGKIFVVSDKCDLTLVRASTEKFEPLGSAKVLQGKDAWAPLALAGDRLLVRDEKVMVCLDVGKGAE